MCIWHWIFINILTKFLSCTIGLIVLLFLLYCFSFCFDLIFSFIYIFITKAILCIATDDRGRNEFSAQTALWFSAMRHPLGAGKRLAPEATVSFHNSCSQWAMGHREKCTQPEHQHQHQHRHQLHSNLVRNKLHHAQIQHRNNLHKSVHCLAFL